jgi:hypothetical protein
VDVDEDGALGWLSERIAEDIIVEAGSSAMATVLDISGMPAANPSAILPESRFGAAGDFSFRLGSRGRVFVMGPD